MSETRIRRGSGARMTAGRSVSSSRPRGQALKKRSALDAFLARLPVSEAMLHRLATAATILIVAGCLWGGAAFFGLPGMARDELANAAARAGFEVKKVEVRGVERMDELAVYNIALGQKDRSMLNVDLPKLRQDLLKLSWIKDARISRRLPDTLVVDVVERQPVAVWQHEGHLALIDVTGAVLDQIAPTQMPELPLVVGPSANLQTANLTTLMDVAPALKPVLAGATWVGNRRWDLRFQSGETLSLPEGPQLAAAALVNFARLDGINRLLGRGIVRFDMRDPDKFVMRMPKNVVKDDPKASGQPASNAAAPAPAPDDDDKPTATATAHGSARSAEA
ncbi:MAG: FtsQ-type POTRA domain-containing protein [Sphingobium sp.]